MKSEEDTIKEAQMWAVAGLSLSRSISPGDIKIAVEEGFKAGKTFALVSGDEHGE